MFVHLKQKKTVKLELNYKYLLLGIAILTLLLVSCRQSGWSLIGGVSKKQAEKNFSDFLTKNYPNELAFTNLKRFFNEGNMTQICSQWRSIKLTALKSLLSHF